MNFELMPDQERLQSHIHNLLDEVCPPEYAARCDEEVKPPREAYDALAKHGWFGLILPPEYGGAGGSAIDLAILLEEAGRHFEELAVWVFRTLTYGGYAVMRHGTPEQNQGLLPKILRGELSFCCGLTEPHSGSDAASLTTKATAAEKGYVINGQKMFTSGMDISDYCLLVTRTSSTGKKQQGITNFLVGIKLPGIEVRRIRTLGQRPIGTTQVFYTDVEAPSFAVLGRPMAAGRRLMPIFGTSAFSYRQPEQELPFRHLNMRLNTQRRGGSSGNRLGSFKQSAISLLT